MTVKKNNYVKFLGLCIDETLSWKHHLSYINKKIARAMYALKRAKQFLPADCLKTLYYSLIHPHLSYGLLAWGNASKTALLSSVSLQKRAIRIICNSNYKSHTEPLFKKSEVLKLYDLYTYNVALFMYDYCTKNVKTMKVPAPLSPGVREISPFSIVKRNFHKIYHCTISLMYGIMM